MARNLLAGRADIAEPAADATTGKPAPRNLLKAGDGVRKLKSTVIPPKAQRDIVPLNLQPQARAMGLGGETDAPILLPGAEVSGNVVTPEGEQIFPPEPEKRGGIAANLGAAGTELMASPGALVDAATGLINTVTQKPEGPTPGTPAIPGLDTALRITQGISSKLGIPPIPDDTVLSSEWIKDRLVSAGFTDPDTVEAKDAFERIIRMAYESAGYTIAPEVALAGAVRAGLRVPKVVAETMDSLIGEGKTMRGVTANAALGGASGAGSQAAMEVAPDNLDPAAGIAGGLATPLGLVAAAVAGKAALKGGVRTVAPGAAREGIAADALKKTLAGDGITPSAAVETIDAAAGNAQGDLPTTPEVLGSPRLAEAAGAAARQDPRFAAREAERIAAARQALDSLADPSADPATVLSAVRGHLDELEAAAAAAEGQSAAASRGVVEDLGKTAAPPNEVGQAIRQRLDAARPAEPPQPVETAPPPVPDTPAIARVRANLERAGATPQEIEAAITTLRAGAKAVPVRETPAPAAVAPPAPRLTAGRNLLREASGKTTKSEIVSMKQPARGDVDVGSDVPAVRPRADAAPEPVLREVPQPRAAADTREGAPAVRPEARPAARGEGYARGEGETTGERARSAPDNRGRARADDGPVAPKSTPERVARELRAAGRPEKEAQFVADVEDAFNEVMAPKVGKSKADLEAQHPSPTFRRAAEDSRGDLNQSARGRAYPTAPRDEWYGEANYADAGGKMTEMSPDEFLRRAKPLEMDEVARDNIDDLKRHIESGKTLDPLKFFDGGKEDGRHRAIAAKELGIDRVPVIEFGDQVGKSPASAPRKLNQSARRGVDKIRVAAGLDTAFKEAGKTTFKTGRDLKLSIQERVKAEADKLGIDLTQRDPAVHAHLVKQGVEDALYALKSNSNAVGWYGRTVSKAMEVLSAIHPEIKTDAKARLAFKYALAVTSNGLKVGKNFELAEIAYASWKKTGKMPTDVGVGLAKQNINHTLGLFNDLVARYGYEMTEEFLSLPFTVGQLEKMGFAISGENAGVVVRGAAALGPKIGNGFYSNLNGHFDALTMDRWLMRTWGRWTGNLVEDNPVAVAKKSAELKDLIKRLTPAQVAEFKTRTGVDLREKDMKALAVALNDASTDPKAREAMNSIGGEVGSSIRKTGNMLNKYLDGQIEAPTPAQRPFIRSVMKGALDNLHDAGYTELTMSDLQALLWYPEKRLYDTAKAKDATSEGYAEDEAPDYANAAIEVARRAGKTDAEIKSVVAKWEKDYVPSTGRAAGARRGDAGEPAAPAIQNAVAGLDGPQRRTRLKLLKRGIFVPDRAARESDGEVRAYSSRGAEGDRGLRGVKAVHTPERGFQATLKAAELKPVTLHELEPGPEAAKKFHGLISASKNASPFGASVYVYDEADYAGFKLFTAPDGKSGFAIKPGGDIVSVFSEGGGAVHSMLSLATEMGGTKLDAFDTVLPDLYEMNGFVEVGRDEWNDLYKPEGWDYDRFKMFKGGKPDVVYMEYRPAKKGSKPAGNPKVLFQSKAGPSGIGKAAENTPFYSAAVRAVENAKTIKASPDQWLATIRNTPGVKQEELEWIGVEPWLKSQEGAVTRDKLAEFMRANEIEVLDTFSEDKAYKTYTMAGGKKADESYRELLLRLPDTAPRNVKPSAAVQAKYKAKFDDLYARWNELAQEGHAQGARALANQIEDLRAKMAWETIDSKKSLLGGEEFRSSHFSGPNATNILAHVRFNDRTLNGKKMLFLEEVQSDWHQLGRKKGYRDNREEFFVGNRMSGHHSQGFATREEAEAYQKTLPESVRKDTAIGSRKITEDGAVPDAPFKTSWPELAMKRMIRWAADNGYDQVAWTPGQVQADRYDLSKHVGVIGYHRRGPDQYRVTARSPDGDGIEGEEIDLPLDVMTIAEVEEYFGKDIAQKIADGPERGRLRGLDLKTGGEGMIDFYDKMLVNVANKLGKKFGAKVGRGSKEGSKDFIHTLDITPEMREAGPMPLFQDQAGPRGQIEFMDDGPDVVTLFSGADASTAMHEVSHSFLKRYKNLAESEAATPELKGDWQTVKTWWGKNADAVARDGSGTEKITGDDVRKVLSEGTTGDPLKDLAVNVGLQEQWARAFEGYLRDGVAPTPRLAKVFESFKTWLTAIYKKATDLDVDISPEIKGVFDRMLGADAARARTATRSARTGVPGNSALPGTIFHPGPKSYDDIMAYKAKVGDADATADLEAYAIDRLLLAASKDGEIDHTAVAAFRKKHADALRALPELAERLSTIEGTVKAMGDVAVERRQTAKEAQQSSLRTIMEVGDDDVVQAVGKMFGGSGSTVKMKRLRAAIGDNKQAQEGLKRSIIDHMNSKLTAGKADASGVTRFKVDEFRAFVRDNKPALKAAGFTDEDLATFDRLGEAMDHANSVVAPMKTGAHDNVIQLGLDLAQRLVGRRGNSTFTRMVITGLLGHTFGGPVWSALAIAPLLTRALRAKGLRRVEDLIHEAYLDPQLARQLLLKASPSIREQVEKNIAKRLMRGTVAGTLAAAKDDGDGG